MFKYFLFFVSVFSFLISDQVEHGYNSVVSSFTKTADPGRINIEITNNNTEYKDIYADDTLTSISFHVNDKSVVGAELKVELYEMDPANDPILLDESKIFSFSK